MKMKLGSLQKTIDNHCWLKVESKLIKIFYCKFFIINLDNQLCQLWRNTGLI